MRQYEKSEEIYAEQIDFNRISANFAKETLREATYERLTKLHFEASAAFLKHRTGMQKMKDKRRILVQGHQQQTAQAAIKSQENLVKSLKQTGAAEAKGARGRSLRKEVNSWWAVAGREDAALQSMIQKAGEQTATKLYGMDYAMGVALRNRHLTKEAHKETRNSILRARTRGFAEIDIKRKAADMQADHKRLLEPEKGPAPIKPDAMPRINWGDNEWKDSFDDHGGIFDVSKVEKLDVFRPSKPGLGKDFREEHSITKKDFSKDFGGKSSFLMGPKFDYRKESGGAVGFGGTGARAGGISVGSVTSDVGAGMMAATAIGAATTGSVTAAGAIGLGGLGSVGLTMLGPIGAGIAAIGFIGTIFDWW